MARKQLQNLTEPMYYILLSLIKPSYGYKIMKNIDELTFGRVKVGAGTLYSLLSRFEKECIVEQISYEKGKKTYILTKKGEEILKNEIVRLKELVSHGDDFLEGENNE